MDAASLQLSSVCFLQARLKEEYKVMAQRLQEMEKKLEAKGGSAVMGQGSEWESDGSAGAAVQGTREGPDRGHVGVGAR